MKLTFSILLVSCGLFVFVDRVAQAADTCFSIRDRYKLSHPDERVSEKYSMQYSGFEVTSMGETPPTDPATFRAYPSTAVTTMQPRLALENTKADPAMKVQLQLWGNRCVRSADAPPPTSITCRPNGHTKGNPLDLKLPVSAKNSTQANKRIWAFFSTFEQANRCTQLQLIHVLGSEIPALKAQIADGGNIDVQLQKVNLSTTWETLSKTTKVIDQAWMDQVPAEIQRQWADGRAKLGNVTYPGVGDMFVSDTCLVWDIPELPAKLDGILLDYEVADLRDAEHTTSLVRSLRKAIDDFKIATGRSNFRFSFFANPLNSAGAFSGIDASNGRALLGLVDRFSITDNHLRRNSSIAANLNEQLAVLGSFKFPDDTAIARKVYLVWEMKEFPGENKLELARAARAWMKMKRVGGVLLWRNGFDYAASCEGNEWQAIGCATMGLCGP